LASLGHAGLAGMARPEIQAALDGRDHRLGQTKDLADAVIIGRKDVAGSIHRYRDGVVEGRARGGEV